MRRLAALGLCVGMLGCASPDERSSPSSASGLPRSAEADPHPPDHGPDPAEPPADIDAFHFIEVENDGRDLRAAAGAVGEGTWTLRYRITNPRDASVYLVGCNDPPRPQLLKWLGGEWRPVHYIVDDACRSPAWEIESGETLPESPEWSVLDVTYEPGAFPGTEGDTSLQGTYRLALRLFTSDPDVEFSSASQIVGTSTRFEMD